MREIPEISWRTSEEGFQNFKLHSSLSLYCYNIKNFLMKISHRLLMTLKIFFSGNKASLKMKSCIYSKVKRDGLICEILVFGYYISL